MSDNHSDPLAQQETSIETLEIPSGPPPRSRAAVVGFWMALVLLIPWVGMMGLRIAGLQKMPLATYAGTAAALAASVLGVVGIIRTRRRQRRGRGLAITAVILGLIGAGLQLLVGTAVYQQILCMRQSKAAISLLRTPTSELEKAAERWHDMAASARFQVAVTPEELADWLAGVVAEHGQLQSEQQMRSRQIVEGTSYVFTYNGQFVNGAARVVILVGMDKGRPRVDDIRVSDSSPMPR